MIEWLKTLITAFSASALTGMIMYFLERGKENRLEKKKRKQQELIVTTIEGFKQHKLGITYVCLRIINMGTEHFHLMGIEGIDSDTHEHKEFTVKNNEIKADMVKDKRFDFAPTVISTGDRKLFPLAYNMLSNVGELAAPFTSIIIKGGTGKEWTLPYPQELLDASKYSE